MMGTQDRQRNRPAQGSHTERITLPGGLGESAQAGPASTAIDLQKRGDVAMVLRAVQNGWNTPQAVRDAIVNRLPGAMKAAAAAGDDRRVFKLIHLALVMNASDLVADGVPKSAVPYLRRRKLERRHPRAMR